LNIADQGKRKSMVFAAKVEMINAKYQMAVAGI